MSGRVTISGESIPADASAVITLVPREAPEAMTVSEAIVGGRYAFEEAPRGPATAVFEITQPFGPEVTSARTGNRYRRLRSLVPDRSVGGVRLEVGGEDQSLDFDL